MFDGGRGWCGLLGTGGDRKEEHHGGSAKRTVNSHQRLDDKFPVISQAGKGRRPWRDLSYLMPHEMSSRFLPLPSAPRIPVRCSIQRQLVRLSWRKAAWSAPTPSSFTGTSENRRCYSGAGQTQRRRMPGGYCRVFLPGPPSGTTDEHSYRLCLDASKLPIFRFSERLALRLWAKASDITVWQPLQPFLRRHLAFPWPLTPARET